MKNLALIGPALFGLFFIVRTSAAGDFSVEQVSSTVAVPVVAPVTDSMTWPVPHSVNGKKIHIVSGFGHRDIPGSADPAAKEMHEGMDWDAPAYTIVRAAHAGRVLSAGFSHTYAGRKSKKDVSRLVIVRHPDGKSTRYVHLNEIRVRPGANVKVGDVIGTVAPSDEWTVNVLHFELHDTRGRAVNPAPLFAAASVAAVAP